MKLRNLASILVLLILAGPALAQSGPTPKSYTDCDALYERELKKAAAQTGKNLRETQRLAGLQRLRCDRAVERKNIMDRAKGANRPGGR
ncbi:MAG: hypothetical protein JNL71_07540 [Rhodospirillales bacterium]|nr:hypothetical protein [Rhodospirillales bacterium]